MIEWIVLAIIVVCFIIYKIIDRIWEKEEQKESLETE